MVSVLAGLKTKGTTQQVQMILLHLINTNITSHCNMLTFHRCGAGEKILYYQ